MELNYKGIVCGLKLSEGFTCTGFMPDGYGRETIVYALTRFLRRNGEARAKLVRMSCEMRFAKGRERKPHRLTLMAPATAMELPCGTAKIRLTVTAFGVEVQSFLLLDAASKRTEPLVWEEANLLPRREG